MALMSCQEEKDGGKKAKGREKKMKKEAKLGVHLVKMIHGITEGMEHLATLP